MREIKGPKRDNKKYLEKSGASQKSNNNKKMKTEDFPDPSVSLIGFVIKYEVKTNKKLFISLEWRAIQSRITKI